MPFFDSVDEDATVEGHAKAVQKLQKSQAQALIDDYKAARLDRYVLHIHISVPVHTG